MSPARDRAGARATRRWPTWPNAPTIAILSDSAKGCHEIRNGWDASRRSRGPSSPSFEGTWRGRQPWIANWMLRNPLDWTFRRGNEEVIVAERAAIVADMTSPALACAVAGVA